MKPLHLGDIRNYRIAPRSSYRGRPVLPAVEAMRGTVMQLEARWLQGERDQYPGEWELWPAESDSMLWLATGRAWISSGDVEEAAP